MTQQIEVTFPSGRVVTIGAPSAIAANPKWAEARARKGACKHIGEPVDVQTGCSGVKPESTWECALHGICAPLAGFVFDKPGVKMCRLCDDWQQSEEPGWAKLGANLLSAVAKWVKAGRPVRSQERVTELLTICNSCPHLVRDKLITSGNSTHCGKCGCPVNNRIDTPTRNKLALSTEECPAGLWDADSPPSSARK